MLSVGLLVFCFFFFKQKTAYEMRISDWSSDVCSFDENECHGTTPCECRSVVLSGRAARALYYFLRRSVFRGRRAWLQGVEVGAGRLGQCLGRERAYLRHVESPAFDAGLQDRKSVG